MNRYFFAFGSALGRQQTPTATRWPKPPRRHEGYDTGLGEVPRTSRNPFGRRKATPDRR